MGKITSRRFPAERGAASAINNVSRQVGVGIAVLGSALAASYRTRIDLTLTGSPAPCAF